MIQITDKSQCCGCTACACVCHNNAITMQPDAMGFLYPMVDEAKCVGCGLCGETCAFNDNYDTRYNLPRPESYAARHKSMGEVETSRSGAAFIALSDYVLEQGGVVYGAGYTDHFRVVHKRATTKEQRNEFKGSKYVQSDLTGVFCQVKKDLQGGLTVLFSGTPCQTAGLNSFIRKGLRERLILIDLVCHGVPSPYLWRDYLTWQEKRNKKKVVNVNFRNKKYGWSDHKETLTFGKREKSFTVYTHFFYLNSFFRPACYACKYCNTMRPSDITLGDFWGVEKVNSTLNKDDKGINILLVNTPKGQNLIQLVSGRLHLFPCKLSDCLQPNLCRPTTENSIANAVKECYINGGIEALQTKYKEDKIRLAKWRLKKKLNSIKKKLWNILYCYSSR